MSGPANEGKVDEMAKPRHTPGIRVRHTSEGVSRYTVEVRRNGQTQRATLPTRHEALAWQAQALSATAGLTAAPEPPPRRTVVSQAAGRAVTVEDAARRLVRGMADGTVRDKNGHDYKPSVLRKYEAALRLDVLPTIGAFTVASLTQGDVQRFADELAAHRSPEHARQALTALRVALRLSARYGELDGNPCAGVTVPASREKDEHRPTRILDAAEARHLLDAAEADDVKHERSFALPFLALLLGSGLRSGEALALRYGPDGLDLAAGLVHVRSTLDRHRDADGNYRELAPKSRTSRRTIPLTSTDTGTLRDHRTATGSPADGSLVFAHTDGKPLAAHGLPRDTFQRVTVAAGLAPAEPNWRQRRALNAKGDSFIRTDPTLRLHELRHTYATHALAAGMTTHAVAQLLGHADAALVWRRYGHALPDEVALAGVTLAAWRESVETDGLRHRLRHRTMP